MSNFLWSVIKKIMGGINQGFAWWWNYIKSIFHIGEFNVAGSIVLGPGLQTITIGTDFPNPEAVFLSVTEPANAVTTCTGNLNWVAARLTDGGFVLFANVTSSSCTIDYVVKYDAGKVNPHDPHASH